MNVYQAIALFSLVAFSSNAVPTYDEVKSVPNCNFVPNFRHYSGYLEANQEERLHYWLVESQISPTTAPVILWLNGGPGCSSLEGLLLELGPFHVHNFGDVVYENVYSWNKFATIIFLESPAGVGYSFTTNGNSAYSDDDVAKSNYNALLYFFTYKFPELKNNDFYIMGESYAGTYLPTLGALLVDDKQNFGNLKGMAIGNGCLHQRFNYNTLIPFVNNHALIDQNFYTSTTTLCCGGHGGECDYFAINEQSPNSLCANLTNELYFANYYSGLDPYNLYFSCYLDSANKGVKDTYRRFQLRQMKLEKLADDLGNRQALPQCAHYNDTTIWLRRTDVRNALHIPSFLPQYDSCSQAVTDNYIIQYTDMSKQIQKVVGAGVRVLIFVGDVDTVCNVMHNKKFVDQLGLVQLNATAPWTFDNDFPSVAGYRTAYQGLDLLTVHGAGHFVSSQFEKPRETQQMIYNFVHNRDYSLASDLNTNPQPPISSKKCEELVALPDGRTVERRALYETCVETGCVCEQGRGAASACGGGRQSP